MDNPGYVQVLALTVEFSPENVGNVGLRNVFPLWLIECVCGNEPRRSGHPYALSPGRLATDTLVSSGTMTNRLDRLERDGLITRAPDPADRRGVIVQLTAAGRDRVDAALSDLLAREEAILAALDDADQQHLAALLRRLTEPFDAI